MPRTSLAALTTPCIDVGTLRLAPRPGLSEAVSVAFVELVSSVAASHFAEADRPLIEALATAMVMAREASAHIEANGLMLPDGRPNPAGKVLAENLKLVRQLATSLRLSPQSRISKEKAGGTAERRGNFAAAMSLIESKGGFGNE